MKVIKVGGGCLRKKEDFHRVVELIKSEKVNPIVVVSALYGMTNLIIEGIRKALKSENEVLPFLKELEERHVCPVKNLIPDNGIRKKTLEDIKGKIHRLERLIFGIAYTEEITESLEALILSYGERISALILSAVLNSREIKAVTLEADEIGIVTDHSYKNATALLPEVRDSLQQNVLPVREKGIVPVITGYFGCTKEGKVTTFGRNGSDYSAAVIASGVNATGLEIWKDVDGFMSADPKIVQDSRRLDRLSYYEAAELSYFGAKIMHPRTVEPLAEKAIPLSIRNIHGENQCTLVSDRSYERKNIIKSVTYNEEISVIKIKGSGVGYKPGIIAEIGRELFNMGINIFSVITSQTCINLLLDAKDSLKSYKSLNKLAGGVIEKVELEENIALIGVVGEGIQKKRGVAARVFSAVAVENINVEMISSGASEVAYYFIIKKHDVKKAINAVHREFF